MSKLKLMGQFRSDDFQTPEWPVKSLIDFIKQQKGNGYFQNKTVWEPACGNKNIVRCLNDQEITCIGTDIKSGSDFLAGKPELDEGLFDLIITNPPYSKKTSFLRKCYEYQKPFALLLPYSSFETTERQKLFKQYGLQVLFLPKRVDFQYPDGTYKKSPWFATAWFTSGFGFERAMYFL